MSSLPDDLPHHGIGEDEAFARIATMVRERSADLGAADALAHMDPPAASIAAKLVGLNATFNQNLLHPDLSPFATEAERRAMAWLQPYFGMNGGHLCAGSTIANLAALWCAREHGATRVVASTQAHISIPKSAHILAMPFTAVATDQGGRLDRSQLPDLCGAALVLTAGTTTGGVIDDMHTIKFARSQGAVWAHVDAAWAGPLRLTRYADRFAGIERADSIAVSAHKWLYQPKESALVMFADPTAQTKIAFKGPYLATPNVGVQGSRGAAGIALMGTLLAWGREGLATRIEKCIALSDNLADRLDSDRRTILHQRPETGVLNWRPADPVQTPTTIAALGRTASKTEIDGMSWIRQVATNPNADLDEIWSKIDRALS